MKKLKVSRDSDINTDYTQVGHQSIFTMDMANHVATMSSKDEAIKYLLNIVDGTDNVKDKTKTNAKIAIMRAKNIQALVFTISNFVLAHQGLNTLGK